MATQLRRSQSVCDSADRIPPIKFAFIGVHSRFVLFRSRIIGLAGPGVLCKLRIPYGFNLLGTCVWSKTSVVRHPSAVRGMPVDVFVCGSSKRRSIRRLRPMAPRTANGCRFFSSSCLAPIPGQRRKISPGRNQYLRGPLERANRGPIEDSGKGGNAPDLLTKRGRAQAPHELNDHRMDARR